MKSGWIVRPGAAEFPHENELIERGTLWIGSALCHVETVVPVRKASKPRTAARIQALAPPMRTEPILPPPMPAEAAATEEHAAPAEHVAPAEIGVEPALPPKPADTTSPPELPAPAHERVE